MGRGCTWRPRTQASLRRHIQSCSTVYVSLYKYFNAPFGAILSWTGILDRGCIRAAAPIRRRFLHAWESAAVALHHLDGFDERYQEAVRSGEQLLRRLEEKQFRVHRVGGGTNVFQLDLPSTPEAGFQKRLADQGIYIGATPGRGSVDLQVK